MKDIENIPEPEKFQRNKPGSQTFWKTIKTLLTEQEFAVMECAAHGMSQYDIAELLKVSRAAVRSYYTRASKKLKEAGEGKLAAPLHL